MKEVLLITALFFFSAATGLSQSFGEFISLRQKADSAYRTGNHTLSLKYYQQILALGRSQRPDLDGIFYYNVACAYSLNHMKDEAITYVEKSYATASSMAAPNPVGIEHVLNDTDLDFVRDDPRFRNVLRKYYSLKDMELYRSAEAFKKMPEISYQTLVDFLQSTDGDLTIENKVIYWKKSGDSIVYNSSALPIPNTQRSIRFVNCTFRLNFVWNAGHQVYNQAHPFRDLTFGKCRFTGRFSIYDVEISGRGQLRFAECIFEKTFFAQAKLDLDETWGGCFIEQCKFNLGYTYINSVSPTSLVFADNELLDNFHLNARSIDVATVAANHSDPGILELWLIDVNALRCNKNKLPLIQLKANVTSEFDFQENEIAGSVIFNDTYFPESAANDVDWSTLDHGRLALFKSGGGGLSWNPDTGLIQEVGDFKSVKLLDGKSRDDISNDANFRSLMGLYSMFLNLYKGRNDIESFNSCFVAVKELQSKRLEYLYEAHKTFEGYFSWKLSQLLKFYVVHGTKPARAIVISIYIIFLFGVFFFFFPSDWDSTSKKRLIQNFKDFIQKNEKGYVRPFFILALGLFVSMLNALTLSLNAFITLGFGNIPTHGVARYVCVLEGFVGWFLLSIFTVAMINQVL